MRIPSRLQAPAIPHQAQDMDGKTVYILRSGRKRLHILVSCVQCGKVVPRMKSEMRNDNRNIYCSLECYRTAIRLVVGSEEKRCSVCGEIKNVSEFYLRKRSRDGLTSQCRPCLKKIRSSEWPRRRAKADETKRKNSARNLSTRLMAVYGISLSEYNEMLAKQNGVCAICGGEQNRVVRGQRLRLMVDHDHTTGQVRGLLCDRCNNLLGRAKDSTAILRKAIDYLEKEASK